MVKISNKNEEEQVFQQANQLYHQGYVSQSILEYKKVLEFNRNNSVACGYLGLAYLALGCFTEAINVFRLQLSLTPNSSEAYNNIGYALFQQGDLVASVAEYLKAVALHPEYAMAYFNLGTSYSNLAHSQKNRKTKITYFTEARSAYQKAIFLKPKWAVSYFAIGIVEQSLHNYFDAIQNYRIAIEIDPTQLEFYIALFKTQFICGQWFQAWNTFIEGRKLNQTSYSTNEDIQLGERYQELIGSQLIPWHKLDRTVSSSDKMIR